MTSCDGLEVGGVASAAPSPRIVEVGDGWRIWRQRHPVTGRLTRWYFYEVARMGEGSAPSLVAAEQAVRRLVER